MKANYPFFLWLATAFILIVLTLLLGVSMDLMKHGHPEPALLVAVAVPLLAVGVFNYANKRVSLDPNT